MDRARKMFVFNGNNSVFPSAIFSTMDKAMEWIKRYNLSGTLNAYPVDVGLYDWAIENDFFLLKMIIKNHQGLLKDSLRHP